MTQIFGSPKTCVIGKLCQRKSFKALFTNKMGVFEISKVHFFKKKPPNSRFGDFGPRTACCNMLQHQTNAYGVKN